MLWMQGEEEEGKGEAGMIHFCSQVFSHSRDGIDRLLHVASLIKAPIGKENLGRLPARGTKKTHLSWAYRCLSALVRLQLFAIGIFMQIGREAVWMPAPVCVLLPETHRRGLLPPHPSCVTSTRGRLLQAVIRYKFSLGNR